ncbi:hypothetical protein AKJ16_DCAP11226 [Drosera capensis]
MAEDKIPWVMFGGSGGATVRTPKVPTTTTTTLPIRVQLKEKILFDRLLEVVKFYNLGSTIRVAGGWVRDKVLGTAEEDAFWRDLMINRQWYKRFDDFMITHGCFRCLKVSDAGVRSRASSRGAGYSREEIAVEEHLAAGLGPAAEGRPAAEVGSTVEA